MELGEVLPTENSEAPSPNGVSESQEIQQTNLDEMIKRETHQRVLKESQKYKQRAMDAEAKANTLEEAKLTEQQQYKELADKYKTELDSVKQVKTELQLKSQLMPLLNQAGCRDITDAMKLGNNELLLSDPDNENLIGVEDYVKDLQQRKPWLFDAGKSSSVNSSLPAPGKVPAAGNKEDYSNLTKEQIMERLHKLG